MLDIKANFRGKYKNLYCEGCLDKNIEETQEHIFTCKALSTGEIAASKISYEDLLSQNIMKQITISEILKKRLNRRTELMNSRVSPVPILGPCDPL